LTVLPIIERPQSSFGRGPVVARHPAGVSNGY
jgi:hypothetical protein